MTLALALSLAPAPVRADAYDTLRGEVAQLAVELRTCAGTARSPKARARAERALARIQNEETRATAAASSRKKRQAEAILRRARAHARTALKACHRG